jgi:tetratricopeptide (TPR) repeat protein
MIGLPLRRLALALLILTVIPVWSSDQPHWIRVSTDHFTVLTDGGEKHGREVALRFEQMRTVFAQLLARNRLNLSEPLEILAVKSHEEYARLAPVHPGPFDTDTAFFLPGDDRNLVVLDLSDDQAWRAVAHPFAHLLLSYNYPPTQGWFDEGLAEYFSSMQVIGNQIQMGGDPELYPPQPDLLGNTSPIQRNPPKSLSDLLAQPVWMSIPDLFTTRHDTSSSFQEGTHHTMFYAESWIVVHYLIAKNKLTEVGNYFQLVENEKLPVEQAIEKAFGMTADQLQQAVRDYYKSIAVDSQTPIQVAGQASATVMVRQFPAPMTLDDMGASVKQLSLAEAEALVAEVEVRLPEHRQEGVKELQAIIADPKTENAVAHRALGWVAMERKDTEVAAEEFRKAMELDPDDAWPRYYVSALRFQNARFNGQYFQGMANMMQDLRAVIDWDPDFASAYNMLAMARLEGGGTNSALEAMQAAIRLAPRNASYQMNLARIYVAQKKWDAATELLKQLAAGSDAAVARVARNSLDDLPTLKKYGILPVEDQSAEKPSANTTAGASAAPEASSSENDDEDSETQPVAPKPDKRPVKFLKGTLVRVDCSTQPVALVMVATGKHVMKLRTPDYKNLVLIGADQFSCGWKNLHVMVNYKAGGKADGDLVSLEIQ